MNRFGNDQDNEIVELLGRLRDTGPEYPPRLFAARRAAVLAALAALPIGGALAVSLFAKLAHVIKGMSVVDKIVLGLEVAAITGVTAYGATAAYIYRDALKTLLFPQPTPFNTLVAPSLSPEPAFPAFGETPIGTPTVGTPTPTGTIYVTDTNVPAGGDHQPGATQPPPEGTKPGWHLGQTKQPPPTQKKP